MNNLTKLSFSLGDDENLKFNGMTPYQYTDREVKIKSLTANGNPLTPDKNKNVDIPIKAQTASYIICAEDSVNKEGAIVVKASHMPGLGEYPNYLQNALDEIFNSADFKRGSKIIIRSGTYHDIHNHGVAPLNLTINKPCTIEFETSRNMNAVTLGRVTLAAFSAAGNGSIVLKNAYCQYVDVCSGNNVVENCCVYNIAPGVDIAYAEGSIIVSGPNNIIRNNIGYTGIYLTAGTDGKYAQRCVMHNNFKLTGEIADYIQTTGYPGTDIYLENSIEHTEYIKGLIPVKSISANGTPLEPDENQNVNIPRASRNGDGLMSSNMHIFVSQLRGVSKNNEQYEISGNVFTINPAFNAGELNDGVWTVKAYHNTVYMLDSTMQYNQIDFSLDLSYFYMNENGYTEGSMRHAYAELIFETKDTAPTFAYGSTIPFIGLDVEDNVFIPQPNMKYDIIFSLNWGSGGNNSLLVGYVSGYELPTNEVS